MSTRNSTGSARRTELLELAYAYTLEHGLANLSLRPLAAATSTSPRVLLYLFGSKDELVQEILARARRDQLQLVAEVTEELRAEAGARASSESGGDGLDSYHELVRRLWRWVAAPERCGTVRLFFEAYALSLRPHPGPWRGFAEQSVRDWTEVLLRAHPAGSPDLAAVRVTRTLALLRGLLLHRLAGGDPDHLEEALLAAL
jgi:AcrR family transcriptional regulator